jgi:hypothetical protein
LDLVIGEEVKMISLTNRGTRGQLQSDVALEKYGLKVDKSSKGSPTFGLF